MNYLCFWARKKSLPKQASRTIHYLMKHWKGIMRIEELVHRDASGRVLTRKTDIPNRIHLLGEDFILRVLFSGGEIPSNYYIGMDSRDSISVSDTVASLQGKEPTQFGYERKPVGSDDFAVVSNSTASMQANSPTVLFSAVGGSFGPVKNIFLCTGLGYGTNATLISSASLGQSLVVSIGETISMKMAMTLSAC